MECAVLQDLNDGVYVRFGIEEHPLDGLVLAMPLGGLFQCPHDVVAVFDEVVQLDPVDMSDAFHLGSLS